MLTVISDLHFEEEASDVIAAAGREPIGLERNVPARAFAKVFCSLAGIVKQNGASRLDLVLAGDIFDLHRTTLWFGDAPRPYVANGEVDASCEAQVLKVLSAIAKEPEVEKTLHLLQLLGRGRYRARVDDPSSDEPFPVPVAVHYLPGNHDRLANSTPAIRSRVRSLLGLPPSPDLFPHTFAADDPRVLVRHGHEYDRYNFSEDYEGFDPFPRAIPEEDYGGPAFGDFVTLEVATALPRLFRDEYNDARILGDPVLRQVYLHLLEFDDVRPQSALVSFLLRVPGGPPEESVWELLRPVVRTLLERICEHEYLRSRLHRLHHDAIVFLLKTKFWRADFALDLLRKHAAGIVQGKGPGCVAVASHEAALQDVRFVIAGHTHEPQVALIGADERYYVDTGTWRHRVLCFGQVTGRVKALTYVTVCASGEDRGRPPVVKNESFDYWSGYTQRWRP